VLSPSLRGWTKTAVTRRSRDDWRLQVRGAVEGNHRRFHNILALPQASVVKRAESVFAPGRHGGARNVNRVGGRQHAAVGLLLKFRKVVFTSPWANTVLFLRLSWTVCDVRVTPESTTRGEPVSVILSSAGTNAHGRRWPGAGLLIVEVSALVTTLMAPLESKPATRSPLVVMRSGCPGVVATTFVPELPFIPESRF